MPAATPLQELLATYRAASKTELEKGNYFEEFTRTYVRHDPTYADLYSDVWLLNEVPDEYGLSKKDTGIDLVAKTHGTGELHAIQCKFYDQQIEKASTAFRCIRDTIRFYSGSATGTTVTKHEFTMSHVASAKCKPHKPAPVNLTSNYVSI